MSFSSFARGTVEQSLTCSTWNSKYKIFENVGVQRLRTSCRKFSRHLERGRKIFNTDQCVLQQEAPIEDVRPIASAFGIVFDKVSDLTLFECMRGRIETAQAQCRIVHVVLNFGSVA